MSTTTKMCPLTLLGDQAIIDRGLIEEPEIPARNHKVDISTLN